MAPLHKMNHPAVGKRVHFLFKNGEDHVVNIIVPVEEKSQLDYWTKQVASLPQVAIHSLKEVQINFLPEFKSNTADGVALGQGRVAMFVDNRSHVLEHEFGHELANYIWGDVNPFEEWKNAFNKDGKKYVTDYADRSQGKSYGRFAEDFAESIKLYLTSKDFRKDFPNRTALLDTIFRNPQSPFGPGGVWEPLRNEYGSYFFRWKKHFYNHGDNYMMTAAVLGTTGSLGGGIGWLALKYHRD